MALLPFNKETLIDFFFPKRCLGCSRIGAFVCEICQERLPYLEVQYCAVCDGASVGGFTHERCRTNLSPDRFLSLFDYKDLARNLVQQFKYQRVTLLGETIGDLVTNFLTEGNVDLGPESLTTFVPIHPLKFLERGFNQSEILAKALGGSLNLEVLSALEKTRETKSQTQLSRKERAENVEDSFGLRSGVEDRVRGRDVLLVDDVFTTGATLLECSRVLKRSGVRFLYLLTLARD